MSDTKLLETKEFWEQVKSEYKTMGTFFLCGSSDLFQEYWSNSSTRKVIQSHATDFIDKNYLNNKFYIGDSFVFVGDSDAREIRLLFLDYMINKFSDEQL